MKSIIIFIFFTSIKISSLVAQEYKIPFFPGNSFKLYKKISSDSSFYNLQTALINTNRVKLLGINLADYDAKIKKYDLTNFNKLEIVNIHGYRNPVIIKKNQVKLIMVELISFVNHINQIENLLEGTTFIDLTNNNIKGLKIKHTKLLSQTEVLRFSCNKAKYLNFSKSNKYKMKSLDISGNELIDLPKNIELLDQLVYLDLTGNRGIKYIDSEKIKLLTNLKTLVIEGIQLSNENLNELKKMPINLITNSDSSY